MAWEILEVGSGGREGASPPAEKMSSTLLSIETGTEQITHDQPSRSGGGGVGIIHLLKNGGWGQREEDFLPPPTRNS